MSDTNKPLISIVFSFRNERENIPELLSRCRAVFDSRDEQFEVIFVDDASTDGSDTLIRDEIATDKRIKLLRMSRKFGVSECVQAGMEAAQGDAVIYLDSDLQDPPELFGELIDAWKAGAMVVHTVRERREGESPVKMKLTGWAYKVINWGAILELPEEAGDYKLLDRRAVTHLLSLTETDPYLRGLVAWVGFKQTKVSYVRQGRHAGRTHFPVFSKNPWRTLVSALTSFSFLPLYVILAAGLIGLALVIPFGLAGLLSDSISGLFVGLLFIWSSLMTALGIISIYILRIYKDVRGRPPYIIAEQLGFDDRDDQAAP